jgi:hypothetical protein
MLSQPPEKLQPSEIDRAHDFLNRFPTSMRSHISNIFLNAIRAGAASEDMVVAAVAATAIQRFQRAQHWQDVADVAKFALLNKLLAAHAGEACHFAAGCIAWEALPQQEKAARKATREGAYRRRHMAGLEATPKQRSYLRVLGYVGPVESRLHASRQIDALRQGGSRDVG